MTFTLRVDGNPVAKGRPRVTSIGGLARAYTPAKTKKYEELVAFAAREAWGSATPWNGPLTIMLAVYLPIPKSWSKRNIKRADTGEIAAISKPDCDNFLKIVTDALNDICYEDDAQIVAATVTKHYSVAPGINVTLAPAAIPISLEAAA